MFELMKNGTYMLLYKFSSGYLDKFSRFVNHLF
jgi:hypothetical protein